MENPEAPGQPEPVADHMADPLAAHVAARLREVSARVRRLDADEETQAEMTRRLLAVTNTAKRDLAAAARRLERLAGDLDRRSRNGTCAGSSEAVR